MPDRIEEKLQAWVEQQLGRRVPIVVRKEGEDTPVLHEPSIVVATSTYGDPWSGYTDYETVTLDNLPRSGTSQPLSIQFCFALHTLSGQCDQWSLAVTGGLPDDEAGLRAAFSPGQWDGHWNNNVDPTFKFNGEKKPF